MARAATIAGERISLRQADKFGQRRDALAEAALQTLAELGYARTSLREIAQNTEFSHGVLHYYFADKIDLITHCVKLYKTACVRRYDEIVATAADAEELRVRFAEAMADTARVDGALHRIWYDMRSQSMFEPALRADVVGIDSSLCAMIWAVVARYGDLADRPVVVTPAVAYGIFDGMFQHALLHDLDGAPTALAELTESVREVLPTLLGQPASSANSRMVSSKAPRASSSIASASPSSRTSASRRWR